MIGSRGWEWSLRQIKKIEEEWKGSVTKLRRDGYWIQRVIIEELSEVWCEGGTLTLVPRRTIYRSL